MTMMDIGYVLNNDGTQFFAGRSMSARDQLGRFVGTLPGLTSDDEIVESGEEKLTADNSLFAQLVANSLHSTDVEEDDADIDFEGIELLATEDADDYLDSEKYAEQRYRADYPELWEDEATPAQSATQHDNYLQELGWWSHKSDRTWGKSHGARGRKNTFWRRSIWKDRGYRRQFWGDVVDLYNRDFDFTAVLQAFDDITQIVNEVECIALDRAYQNGDYGYYGQWDEFEDDCLLPERIPYGFYGDEWDDYGFDSDYDERYATGEDMRSKWSGTTRTSVTSLTQNAPRTKPTLQPLQTTWPGMKSTSTPINSNWTNRPTPQPSTNTVVLAVGKL
jgi:hypothetical protein